MDSACAVGPCITLEFSLRRIFLLVACLSLFTIPSAAIAETTTNSELAVIADLDIEALANIEITSVSKKETPLNDSPAAIAAITSEDIRRLGITTIPEALRLVPGLHVARVEASKWAISSRGFNNLYANKLLVLMDGRSVYTPSFGGVYWNAQDMVLEDMERIEVIRGPGATLWGANAVNGVINIISKDSKDTQGWLLSGNGGTEDQPSASLRYGGEINPELHYRAYVKYFNRDGLVDENGDETPDDWSSIRGGFRMDWEPSEENQLTFQGDYYELCTEESVNVFQLTPPFDGRTNVREFSRGGNVLGRWTHRYSEDSHLSLQAYFDHFREEQAQTIETRNTADIQLENRFPLGQRNDIMWGIGYRFTTDEFKDTPSVTWTPSEDDLSLYTAFVQDEITVVPDRFFLTFGCKFEHNDITGFEIQPGARALWTPTDHQRVWASVSRAVSTPSRFPRNGRLNMTPFQPPFSPVFVPALLNNPDLESEELYAFELGYRVEPARQLSLDFTTFLNVYDNLQDLAQGDPFFEATPQPHMVVPLTWQNVNGGHTYGGEIAAQWKPFDCWRLMASYSLLQTHLHGDDKGHPEHQASLRSYLELPGNLEFNAAAYYVDQIEVGFGSVSTSIPAYVRLDLGLVWRPKDSLEVGVWGQNLLENHHAESTAFTTTLRTEVPRGFMAKVTWRF
jgi:iron complex outermembrane receptor protein